MTSFRKLKTNDDLKKVATWIYLTDKTFFDFLFNNKSNALKSIEKLICSEYLNPYHGRFITVIYDDNPKVFYGIAVRYKGSQLSFKETFKAISQLNTTTSSKIFLSDIYKKIFSSHIRGDDYYLSNLYVDSSHRNKSYASKLVEKVKQNARQSNSNNLFVDVNYSKKDLINFFEQLEFEIYSNKYSKIFDNRYNYCSMKYKIK